MLWNNVNVNVNTMQITRVLSIVLFLMSAKHLIECSIVNRSFYFCAVIFRVLSESY